MPYYFDYNGQRYEGQYPTLKVATLTDSYNLMAQYTATTTASFVTFNTVTINATGWYDYRAWGTPYQSQGWFQGGSASSEELNRKAQAEQKKKEAAKKKALTLLRQNISRKQWNSYKELGYFEVISQKGNVYRIYEGRSRNVKRMDGDKVVEILCAHPKEYVPNGDTLLSQKLMLECMEDTFRKIANISKVGQESEFVFNGGEGFTWEIAA